MEAQRKAAVATAQEEPAEAALEQRVAGEEKALSATEFTELIALADSLRQYDQRKSAISPEEGLAERIGGSSYSVGTAYEVARELGIDADYIKRAQQMLFPTAEMQLVDIKKYSARLTGKIVSKKYECELLHALQEHLPQSRITVKIPYYTNLRIINKREKKLWKKKRIADFYLTPWEKAVHSVLAHFNIFDPIFFRVCDRKLEELQKHFVGIGVSVQYEFRIQYLV